MNFVIGLKNANWDLNKSKYSEIDDLPLMATLGPVLTVLAVYLVFVLKVGPVFMRKREAYKLTHVMLIYNAVQVAISVYLVWRFFFNLLEMGLVPQKCFMDDFGPRYKILFGIYLYFCAKVTELLDTVFFVFRKKESQITFLHLYHHSVMVIGSWVLLKYFPSHTLMFIGFLNSLVHVFMYTYYGLAALGPNVAKYLTWKKYMTKFQLIQFIFIIIQYVATVKVSECPPSRAIAIFVSCNTAFILLLFLNFYRQSYIKKKREKKVTNINLNKTTMNGKPMDVIDTKKITNKSNGMVMAVDTSCRVSNGISISNIAVLSGKTDFNCKACTKKSVTNGSISKSAMKFD